MENYRKLKSLIAAGFFIYLTVALAGLPTENHEIFPCFAWILFPVTPNTVEQYRLELDDTGTEPFKPRPGAGDPIDYFASLQRLGSALAADQMTAVERERRFLESNYLPPETPYRLVLLRMDPAHYYRTGDAERSVIQTFRVDAARTEGSGR